MIETRMHKITRAGRAVSPHIYAVAIGLVMLLTSCGTDDKTYEGFAASFHQLLFRADNYDTYMKKNKPQDSEFFYDCLDKHRDRNHKEARKRIEACYDRCGRADSVCNFNCNTGKGTEFFEARRDLLELKREILKKGRKLDILQTQGMLVGEVECLGINTVRTFEGKPALSCREIGRRYKQQYIEEYTCEFEKEPKFFVFEGDWEIE